MNAKLYWFFEDREKTLSNLKESFQILSITHGPDHPIITEQLQPILNQARGYRG